VNLYLASGSADLDRALLAITSSPGGVATSSSLVSGYPPVILLSGGSAALVVGSAVPYVLQRNTLISGPMEPQVGLG
jgi:hypothetical protein